MNKFERLAMARPAYPFGEGHAAPQIAMVIEQWLKYRSNGAP